MATAVRRTAADLATTSSPYSKAVENNCTSPRLGAHDDDNHIVATALHILESRARTPGPSFTTTDVAATWFHLRLSESPQEVMAVAWLDENLCLIEF